MGYATTTGVILYWKQDKTFIIHRAHNVWFDEYNSRLSIEDKHTPGSLLLRQDPEDHIHNSYLLNLTIKIWGVRVYIMNGRATRKKLDDRSHRGYFMGYAATTGVII